MSSLEADLIRELEIKYKRLAENAEDCIKAIELLQKQTALIEAEIKHLTDLEDSAMELRISELRKEHIAITETYNQKTKELKEINEKMQLALMNCNFQKSISTLWQEEESYQNLLNEKYMSPQDALLKIQGYVIPNLLEHTSFLPAFVNEFIRIGRPDIAELLNNLKDPEKHEAVFQLVQTHYTKTPDYNYGCVLSFCYEHGFGTEIDKKAALKIDLHFADLNHPLALCSVANELFTGDIIEFDQKKAIEYYQRATSEDQNSFYLPHFFWGNRLLDGEGVEKNIEQGLSFLRIADEKGVDCASIALATHFLSVVNDQRDALEAAEVNAAAEGNVELPVPSADEIKQAREQVHFYAKKAYELNLVIGKSLLAVCYGAGYGVIPDHQRYFELLNQAAALGYAGAMLGLASFYQDGLGGVIAPNPIQALNLFFNCLRRATVDVLDDFKKLIADNQDNPEFMTVAHDLCRKCLQGHLLDNPLDSTVIGLFYQHGILIPKNIERAILCFRKGADLGVEEAATALVLLSTSEEKGNIPASLARKYFSYAEDNDGVAAVRLQYRTKFMPLFNLLKDTWSNIGLNGEQGTMPNEITRLITDYAIGPEDKKEKAEAAVAPGRVSQ